MSRKVFLALMALPVMGQTPRTYHLASDWNADANPNGVWSLREGTNLLPKTASWFPLIFSGVPQPAWANSASGFGHVPCWFQSVSSPIAGFDWAPGDVVVHSTDNSGGEAYGLTRVVWTSPFSGTVNVSGSVWLARDIGRGNIWRLKRNDSILTQGSVSSGDIYSRTNPFPMQGGTGGAGALQSIAVSAGTTLSLELEKTSTFGEFTGINLVITEVISGQPPSSTTWTNFRPDTALIHEQMVWNAPYDVNQSPMLAKLADGRLLVTWHQGAPTNGFSRAYEVSTAGIHPVSQPIPLNPNTPDAWKFGHIVTPLVDGGFASFYGYSGGTRAQRFGPQYVPLGGQIVVPPQDTWPDAVVLPNGHIQVLVGGQNATTISLQRFDGSLQAVGGPRPGNQTPAALASYQSSIAVAPNGNYTILFTTAAGNVVGRSFDSSDQPLGAEFTINSSTGLERFQPTGVYSSTGDLWVAWAGPGGGDMEGIFARRLSASGVPLGPEFLVNQTTAGRQVNPHLASGETGEVVIAWSGFDESAEGVFARLYNSYGIALTNEFRVNQHTAGIQRMGAFAGRKGVRMTRDRAIFSWVGSGANGTGIFLTTFSLAPARNRFVPLAPCRLMETRNEYNFEGRIGAFGPPFLAAGETRTLMLPGSSVCSVPSNARAYVLNVTLIPRGGADFVTLFPGGDPRPDVWTVRSPDGQIVANSTITAAGTGGAISVYSSNAADVLVDISGYFTDETTTGVNSVFYPMTPCRVIETRAEYRSPAGPFGPPTLNAGETRRYRFPLSPHCTIPSGATAYSVTLTAVPPQPLAFMSLWNAGETRPNVSSINSFAGRVLANHLIVPASADGSIDVFTFGKTDFIVDINGYFAPDDGINGLYYYTATQRRFFDTRQPATTPCGGPIMGDESQRTIGLWACSGLPIDGKAYHITATALPEGSPMPFLTAWPSGQSMPNASFLNAFQGQVVSNSTIVPAGPASSINLFAYRRTHVVLDVNGWFGR